MQSTWSTGCNVVIILTHKTKLLLRPVVGGGWMEFRVLCFTFYDHKKNAIKMFKVDQIGAKQRKVHLLSAFPVAGHLISLLSSLYLYFHFII